MIKHFSYSMTNPIYNTAASNSLIFQMSDNDVKGIHYRNSEMAGMYCFLHEFSLYMNFYGTSLGDFTNRACGHSFYGLLACCS